MGAPPRRVRGRPLEGLLAGLIPQPRVMIPPDAAHGFLFQHHAEFARDLDTFLRE